MTVDTLHADFSPGASALLAHLIASHGVDSSGYDPASPPYAVFDCDNTTLFRDVQDAVLTEQLARLTFGLTADALGGVLERGIELPHLLDLLHDSMEHLALLRGESGTLEDTHRASHQLALTVKLRALYHALGEHHSDGFACSWVTRLYAGLTPSQVHDLARSAYVAEQSRPVAHARQTSPEGLRGRAGVVDVTWPQGLRPFEPMITLFEALERAGFEVWICSASFEHIVRAAVCGGPLGYSVRASHVMGMRLELDDRGRFLATPPASCVDTHGGGKTRNIDHHVASRLGSSPALVAGDSNGDAPMLAAYPDAARLILNRHLDGPISELCALASDPTRRVALQGRDESRGVLIPKPDSILTAP